MRVRAVRSMQLISVPMIRMGMQICPVWLYCAVRAMQLTCVLSMRIVGA